MTKQDLELHLEDVKSQISEKEQKQAEIESSITEKEHEINRFEYECSDEEYEDFLNECYEAVTICGFVYEQGTLLKQLDPIAFSCGKSEYESNYDLEDVEEYQDLKAELESLEDELSDIESELETLNDELTDLESDLENFEE